MRNLKCVSHGKRRITAHKIADGTLLRITDRLERASNIDSFAVASNGETP